MTHAELTPSVEKQIPYPLDLGILPVKQVVQLVSDNARLGPTITKFEVKSMAGKQPSVRFHEYEGMKMDDEPFHLLGSYHEKSWPGKRSGKLPEDFAAGIIVPRSFIVIREFGEGSIESSDSRIIDWKLMQSPQII